MKRALLVLMAVLLSTSICWAAAPKGKEVTITGTLTCAFCNLRLWESAARNAARTA